MVSDDRFLLFVSASVLLHAAALAWVDVSGGAAVGRLPATLQVLIETRGGRSAEPADPVEPATPPAPAFAEIAELSAREVEPLVPGRIRVAASRLPAKLEPLAEQATQPAADPGGAARRGELLTLLHAAISRHKRYPALALRQRREGTATVSFNLRPSGEMDAIGVDRSSGFGPLDHAAVTAVSRVAPFAPAKVYLNDVTRFTVDVTFRLH